MAIPKLLSSDLDGRRRWYYDACTLDRKETYADILNSSRAFSIVCITSHLGLGEAHGACLVKGEEQTEAFLELLSKMSPLLHIVGHDGIDDELKELRKEFPRLSLTDSIHLATAIKYKCESFKTTDQDFIGLSKREILEVAQKHGCPNFAISFLKG